jgi:hypothetical protein
MGDSKEVYDMCIGGAEESVELEAFLEEHPGVDVNLHRDARHGLRALHETAKRGHTASTRLLIRARADLEVRSEMGSTPLNLASALGRPECLQVLIESKADIRTATDNGFTPALSSAGFGTPKCLSLLIDAKADLNARANNGLTPAILACQDDRLTCLQLLVDAKADLSTIDNDGNDALSMSMCYAVDDQAHRVPGMPFAVLSCNTDSKSVLINQKVTQATVTAHINEYRQIHNFIDDCHDVIKYALGEDVVVDKRVGRRGNGLYHEPLEQVLLYLGLSLTKDQTVSASIDGNTVTRALIPGHPTNANMWFELYKRASVLRVSKLPPGWGCVDPRQRASDNKKYEPQFTIKNTKKKKKKRR